MMGAHQDTVSNYFVSCDPIMRHPAPAHVPFDHGQDLVNVNQSNKYFSQTNISILCHLYIQHKINLHFTKDKGILKDLKCMKVFTLRLGSI